MRRLMLPVALLLLSAFSVFADESLYTITPASGPASGGTTVTIKGPLGSWPYAVVFDDASAVSTTRIDENTLEAVTPEHQPGFSRVRLFEYDIYIDTGLTFEFVGPVAREQFLLPVFIPPVQGAFGSEFRTELRGVNSSMEDPNDTIEVWGLETSCRPSPPICNWLMEPMVFLQPGRNGVDILDYSPYQTGTPGRFIEVPREQVDKLSLNLRVYDTSRSAENFGTAIPIVPRSEFRHQPFALLGVPLDPRFRNTLRVYATGATKVQVQIGDETQELTLRGGSHRFDPAFAQLTAGAFPTGSGTTNVIITPDDPTGPAVWAFISVTNNDTQHITTISPR